MLIVRSFGGEGMHDSDAHCGMIGPITNEGAGRPGDILFDRVKICRAELGFVENYTPLNDKLLAKLATKGYVGPVKVGMLCAHATSNHCKEK